MQKLGQWAFILGLVLSVAAGFGLDAGSFAWVLALLGLAVGFLNVTGEETQEFLIASIGMIMSATAVRSLPYLGDMLTRIMGGLVIFIAPALLVVALKTLLTTAKDA